MFLTTNRIGAIDPAFKSRIDLILPYYDLDEPARRNVWANFVSRLALGKSEISESDFDELALTTSASSSTFENDAMILMYMIRRGLARGRHVETASYYRSGEVLVVE